MQDFGGTTPFYEGEKTDNEDMDSLLDELSRHDEDVVGWKGRLENLGAKKGSVLIVNSHQLFVESASRIFEQAARQAQKMRR